MATIVIQYLFYILGSVCFFIGSVIGLAKVCNGW